MQCQTVRGGSDTRGARTSAIWLVIASLLFGVAAPAAGPRLSLLDVTVEPESAWRGRDFALFDRLRADLEASGLSVMGAALVDDYFAEPLPTQTAGLLEQARQQLSLGRALATELKPDSAIAELGAGLRKLRAIFADLPNLRDLEEAHLQLGMTYQAVGRDQESVAEYRMVLLLRPERTLNELEVNPLVIERFEQVRRDLVSSLRGSVSLLSRPSGARVLMDGHGVGFTPITIPGVFPGEHYFSLEYPGHKTWFGVLSVAPGGVAKEEVFLSEGQRIDRIQLLRQAGLLEGEGPRTAAEALAAGLGVEALVLVATSHPGGTATLKLGTYQRGGALMALGTFPLVRREQERALIDRLRRHLAGDRTAFAPEPRLEPLQPPTPVPAALASPASAALTPWYRSWWFWTAVGAVAVGTATTVSLLALPANENIRIQVFR